MAIITKAEPKTTDPFNSKNAPAKNCPVCGRQMFSYEKQGSYKRFEACFSDLCCDPVPVAMIQGDIAEFSTREYHNSTTVNSRYPPATEYSAELRARIKALMESWGFTRISFAEPSADGKPKERHTIVMACHVSPEVNVGYRKAPNTQRVLVFHNKYGVVTLSERFHEGGEKQFWAWHDALYALNRYLKTIGMELPLKHNEITFTLPKAAELKSTADNKATEEKKSGYFSAIFHHKDRIDTKEREIEREKEYIEELREQYKAEFGEDVPPEKL